MIADLSDDKLLTNILSPLLLHRFLALSKTPIRIASNLLRSSTVCLQLKSALQATTTALFCFLRPFRRVNECPFHPKSLFDTQYASFLEPDVSPPIGLSNGNYSFPQASPCFLSLSLICPLCVYVCLRMSCLPVTFQQAYNVARKLLLSLLFIQSIIIHFHLFHLPSLSPKLETFHSLPILHQNSKHVVSSLPQPAKSLLGLHRQP